MRRRALAALATAALAGCAGLTPRPAVDFAPLADAPFTATGRLSARRGDDGVAANFRWRHELAADELTLSTPMGTALAELRGETRGVRVVLADGATMEARDWESLTMRVLGAPFPVNGLAWWVRSSPRPGSAYVAEAADDRRLALLRQDGWEIAYTYRDGDARATRLVLRSSDAEVRVVVDAWAEP